MATDTLVNRAISCHLPKVLRQISGSEETVIDRDEWVLDTPYLHLWRTQIEEAQKEANWTAS